MSDFYIAPDWLEVVRNGTLFYPAAGSDYSEVLAIFGNHIDTFWFNDIGYPTGLNLPSVFPLNADLRLVQRQASGATAAMMELRTGENGRPYRFLRPSKLTEIYERNDGRRVIVIRRRGFGQIALSRELSDRSLGVFMHRGDSPGESGSNVYFLANKKTNHEPCGNLFDKIGCRLTDRALIVSDGSNTSRRQLRRFHRTNVEGRDAFSYHQGRDFIFGDFLWTCVGWLSRRYGPTLVWGLTRQITF